MLGELRARADGRFKRPAAPCVSHIAFFVGIALAVVAPTDAFAAERIRVAVQRTGTLAWEIDVIRTHGLDRKADLQIDTIELASTEAGKIALKGGSADLMLSDWLWVSRERSLGDELVFYPSSSTLGAVMVPAQSNIKGIGDLKGRKLAIAGGPLDKSWLLLQGLARRSGLDLRKQASVVYGAPPLLTEKALQGEVEATLTFWNFCADLESKGFRRAVGMDEVMMGLGAKGPVAIVGYTFDNAFAVRKRAAIDGFLAAVRQAKEILGFVGSGVAAARPACRRARPRGPGGLSPALRRGHRPAPDRRGRRPTPARFTACSLKSAAPNWSDRRATLPPVRSTAPRSNRPWR